MSEKKNNLSIAAKANQLGRRLELAIIIVLTLSYISQGAKNSISTVGLILILLALWVPVIISFIVYKKNPESGLIKHIIGVGYGVFYLLVCIISEQQLVYTYAFPMLVAVMIYCDLKFSLIVGSLCTIIAIVHAVYFAVINSWSPHSTAAMLIEIASALFVSLYTVLGNRFIINMNNNNLNKIKVGNENTEKLLDEVMEVSTAFADGISQVTEKMEVLAESSAETRNAMDEVTNGTTDTAETVQTQLIMTEQIQNQVDGVTEASDSILKSVEEAVAAIADGKNNINNLMEQAKISEEAGGKTVTEVEELIAYTKEMEGIISLIQGITNQTSMLSLNASIEAARAGEAGRGFAVVADQISTLATQTKKATEDISSMIGNVTEKMAEVAQSIDSLVESNKVQNESANVTAESFEKIAANTETISSNSQGLSSIVHKLDEANREIVDSVQNVSAISEEVSAHATDTAAKTEETEAVVREVQDVVAEMNQYAERLRGINL